MVIQEQVVLLLNVTESSCKYRSIEMPMVLSLVKCTSPWVPIQDSRFDPTSYPHPAHPVLYHLSLAGNQMTGSELKKPRGD